MFKLCVATFLLIPFYSLFCSHIQSHVDSYSTSTSSTPDDQSRSVLQNTSSDKDQERQQHSEENTNINSDSLENSDKVISETEHSSPGVALSEKNLEFESPIYNTAVDSLFAQNNSANRFDFHPTGVENSWPYDLSRTTGTLEFPQSASTYYSATNFRNHYTNTFYNQASAVAAMKGKLMTLTQFNDPLSPPSSTSSSDSSSDAYYYGSQDNNSYINYHENNNNFISSMSSHPNQFFDEDFSEILKNEYNSVEDSGQYTILTNASTGGTFEYLHDHIPRNFGHQYSTSSGESRSPSDAFNPTDDYDNNMQNFTHLTQLTTRPNGLYASSPITDGMISNYDSTHGLTPSLASNR